MPDGINPKVPPKSTPGRPGYSAPRPTQPATRANQASPVIVAAPIRTSETFKKRRTGLWAIGVAIIVGTGAVLGAQLKSRQQIQELLATERRALVEGGDADAADSTEVASTHNEDIVLHKPAGDTETRLPPNQAAATTEGTSASTINGGRGMTYDQRQVSFLEDRRGVLMKQKFDLERKIERVREKRKKEEEMEGRRSIGLGSDK